MLAGLCKANLLASCSGGRRNFGQRNHLKKPSPKFKSLGCPITDESESSEEDDEEGIYIANDYHDDQSMLIKKSMSRDGSTENPAYGIFPYYCDCCSCCCDSESDTESESSCSSSSSSYESLSLSCSSVSSTTSDDETTGDCKRSSYEELNSVDDKSDLVKTCDVIDLDLMENQSPEVTISTQVKMSSKSGSDYIHLKLENVRMNENSVLLLRRSNSVGKQTSFKQRVSGRRKADSWAGMQNFEEVKNRFEQKPFVNFGRREQKKQNKFITTENVSGAKLLEKVNEEKIVQNVDCEHALNIAENENKVLEAPNETREGIDGNRMRNDDRQSSIPDNEIKVNAKNDETYRRLGNTIDTDENKLNKLDAKTRNSSIKSTSISSVITEIERQKEKNLDDTKSPAEVVRTKFKNSENENIEKLLEQGSEKDPANLPMVVMQACQLQLSLNPASRDKIIVPMGTIINALYKHRDDLRVKTPHGDEGLIKHSNCAPLVSLPTSNNRSGYKIKDLRIYKRTPLVDIPVIKPKILSPNLTIATGIKTNPNIPKTKLLHTKLKRVQDWQKNDETCAKNISSKETLEPPDETQSAGLILTEGPILVVTNDYASRGRSTLTVKQNEFVTLLNKDLKDWYWVRACSGQQGFIPKAYVATNIPSTVK